MYKSTREVFLAPTQTSDLWNLLVDVHDENNIHEWQDIDFNYHATDTVQHEQGYYKTLNEGDPVRQNVTVTDENNWQLLSTPEWGIGQEYKQYDYVLKDSWRVH